MTGSLTDDEAAELLDRLGEGFPDRMPAPGGLLAAGRAARRRRTTRSAVAAAVAVVLVVAGGSLAVGLTRVVDGQASPVDQGRPTGPEIPLPPVGMQWAGLGRVVVAVPDGWSEFRCGPFQRVAAANKTCRDLLQANVTTTPLSRMRRGEPFPAEVDGVRESDVVCRGGACSQTIAVVALDAHVSITTLEPTQLTQIHDSLQVLPPALVFVDGAIEPAPTPVTAARQVLGEWRAVTVDGRELSPEQSAVSTLSLTDDATTGDRYGFVSASGSCRSTVTGRWDLHDGLLDFALMRRGLFRHCTATAGPPAQERITRAQRLALDDDGHLVLLDAAGTELATYERV